MNHSNPHDVTQDLQGNALPQEDAAPAEHPQRIGRYRIEKVLGKCGFGLVVQNYLQGCLHDANTGKQPVKQMGVTIFAFERVVENGQAQAIVKLRINNHDYEAAVPANTMDMHATASAFGKAMQQICEAVARDL